MRKLLFSLFLALILTSTSFAELQVQLSYGTFFSTTSGSYVEVYLSFVPNNLIKKASEHGYYAELDVTYSFTKGEENIKTEQFTVQTPYVSVANSTIPPFVSLHRIFLENGEYDMKVSIREDENDESPIETVQHILLNYTRDLTVLSDIELFQSSKKSNVQSMFQKNGYEIIPYAYEIVPEQMNQLGFYAEFYNADKKLGRDSSFLITYYLEEYESGQIVRGFKGFSRKKASDLNVIMGQFLVGNLPEGNYNIKIDVLSRYNELITTRKIPFHKVNPNARIADAYSPSFVDRYVNSDSLAKHIEYIEPIADKLEWEFAQNQLLENDLDLMKKYFLNFWQQRDALQPEKAWRDYLRQVYIVNENFDTPMREGYLTDRGFRYLKYGPPNDRYESFDEPRAFPYEIWYYNQVNRQSNRMIVFANKSAVLNDYVIIHSDINGELYNKDWNLELHRITPGVVDDANPVMQDHFGNKSKDWTNLPR